MIILQIMLLVKRMYILSIKTQQNYLWQLFDQFTKPHIIDQKKIKIT